MMVLLVLHNYTHDLQNYFPDENISNQRAFNKGEDGGPRCGVDAFVRSPTFTLLFHLTRKILTQFLQS